MNPSHKEAKPAMATGKFHVHRMESPKDAEQVQQALNAVFGIQEVKMQRESGEVTFSYDERSASFQDFKHAVMDAGFTVLDDGEVSRIEKERIER
jgi:copper chaperone CopZ